jgi:hypothetical protein
VTGEADDDAPDDGKDKAAQSMGRRGARWSKDQEWLWNKNTLFGQDFVPHAVAQ